MICGSRRSCVVAVGVVWCVAGGALAGCGSVEVSAADAMMVAIPDSGGRGDAGAPADTPSLRRGGADGIEVTQDDDAAAAADGGTGGEGGEGGDDAAHTDDAAVSPDGAGVEAGDAATRVCTVKINEVQTGGATALDEFVELYNTCPDRPLDLTGWKLVYRSDTGTTDVTRVAFAAGATIAADHPYLVCA